MARYATRTCTRCGVRKPQPEMVQKEVYVETGKSKAGVSGATWAGMMMGDKKSENSINRWLFNTNQRTYKRKKQLWLCKPCAPKVGATGSSSETLAAGVGLVFLMTFAIFLFG